MNEAQERQLTLSTMWVLQWEDSHLWIRKRALIWHQICWDLDLGLLILYDSPLQQLEQTWDSQAKEGFPGAPMRQLSHGCNLDSSHPWPHNLDGPPFSGPRDIRGRWWWVRHRHSLSIELMWQDKSSGWHWERRGSGNQDQLVGSKYMSQETPVMH